MDLFLSVLLVADGFKLNPKKYGEEPDSLHIQIATAPNKPLAWHEPLHPGLVNRDPYQIDPREAVPEVSKGKGYINQEKICL